MLLLLEVYTVYSLLVVFSQKAYLIHWVRLEQYKNVEEAYDDGMKRLEALVSRVHDIQP